ncbi:thioredoxin [Candidatus Parcubacteria bacterium]|nr:MAG: thioredoxin [Candidatus Parcubacteria bacterium]
MEKHFTDDNFEAEVITASKEKPVLVDFYADWCAPCKMQGPIIEEVAKELADEAIVGKLNTEEAMQTAAKYGIMSIPTLLVFKGGAIVEQMVGVQPKEGLIETLKKHK